MTEKRECIAAIATPNTAGSVAMIRISGENAPQIASAVFQPLSGKPVAEMPGYTAAYGEIRGTDGAVIDDGILLMFRSPKSYTGENVAEITCHGGVYVARRVLQACISAGARLAEPGEFTMRAVLNGKMSLTQAEAVVDVINSVSGQYLACANAQKFGALERRVSAIAEKILAVSAHIAAWLDYPDEGLDSFETSSHIGQLEDCRLQLSLLLKTRGIAEVLREGIVTAIVGKPNAGKSTLMNLLAGSERSIVADIPGTTRDVVEETVAVSPGGDTGNFRKPLSREFRAKILSGKEARRSKALCLARRGNAVRRNFCRKSPKEGFRKLPTVVLRLCDCAGFRETDDKVEQIGIEYMFRRIDEAALILAVFDHSRPLDKDDLALIERIRGKNAVCVINKIDLPAGGLDLMMLSTRFRYVVEISAKDPSAPEILANVIGKVYDLNALDLSAGFVANERQRLCAEEAERLLGEAIAGIQSKSAPLDATGFLLESALESLYRLSGKSASDEIIKQVFSKFCVGK